MLGRKRGYKKEGSSYYNTLPNKITSFTRVTTRRFSLASELCRFTKVSDRWLDKKKITKTRAAMSVICGAKRLGAWLLAVGLRLHLSSTLEPINQGSRVESSVRGKQLGWSRCVVGSAKRICWQQDTVLAHGHRTLGIEFKCVLVNRV